MAAEYVIHEFPDLASQFDVSSMFLNVRKTDLMCYSKDDLIAIIQRPAIAIALYNRLHPPNGSRLSDVCARLRSEPAGYLFLSDTDLSLISEAPKEDIAQALNIPHQPARTLQESCDAELHRRHFFAAAMKAIKQ
eukprot:m.20015 g.20015  ORF g.20015 m.20015 type:complete len:135 (-) comp3490_c0_seq2:48-452(-)